MITSGKLNNLSFLITVVMETLGYVVAEMRKAIRRCINCGTIMPDGEYTCPRCGYDNGITK